MKRYLPPFPSTLSLTALVLFVLFSAFTSKNTAKTNDVWYVFTSTDYGQVDDHTLYESLGSSEEPVCPEGGNVCAIRLPDNGLNPDATDFDGLKQAIMAAQQNQTTSNPDIRLKE
jgi:hypothetical protein